MLTIEQLIITNIKPQSKTMLHSYIYGSPIITDTKTNNSCHIYPLCSAPTSTTIAWYDDRDDGPWGPTVIVSGTSGGGGSTRTCAKTATEPKFGELWTRLTKPPPIKHIYIYYWYARASACLYIYICLHAFELNCGFDRDYNLGSKIRPERDCQTRRTKRPQTWYLFVTFWTSWEVARRQFRKTLKRNRHTCYLLVRSWSPGRDIHIYIYTLMWIRMWTRLPPRWYRPTTSQLHPCFSPWPIGTEEATVQTASVPNASTMSAPALLGLVYTGVFCAISNAFYVYKYLKTSISLGVGFYSMGVASTSAKG